MKTFHFNNRRYIEPDLTIRKIACDDPYYTRPCIWLVRAYKEDGTVHEYERFCSEAGIQDEVLSYYTIEADWEGYTGADYYKLEPKPRYVVKGSDRTDYPIEEWFDNWWDANKLWSETNEMGGSVEIYDTEG